MVQGRITPARIGRALLAAAVVSAAVAVVPLGAAPASAAVMTTFYVDPVNGSDSNTGTSTAAAFRTVTRAQTAVRSVNASMTGDVVVDLRGGTYTLTSALTLGTADSGQNGYKVIWQAYPGETPVLTSAQTVSGWTSVGGGQYRASTGGRDFRQMYVNGVRASVARYPDAGRSFQIQSGNKTTQRLLIASSQISSWANFTNVEMVLQLQWAENYLPLASYTVSGTSASVAIRQSVADVLFPRPYPLLSDGSPFHFENAREFISEPGEFYNDTSAGYVYYLPRTGEDLSTASVTVPALQTLVSLTGTSLDAPAHDVTFSGITFADTTWTLPSSGMLNAQGGSYNLSANTSNQQYVARPPAAVYVADADRIAVTGNTFTRTGSTALDLHHGVHDSTVTGNVVTTSAGNGIMAGKFSDPTVEYHTVYNPPTSPSGEDAREVVKNITVSNNLITHTGLEYYGTAGINAGFVNSVSITHNEITDVPWAGISLGWGWQSAANALGSNTVSYNEIADVMNLLCDAAGIYHLSNDPGTVMSGNYIHDVRRSPWACGSAVAGFYLDEGSNNMSVTNNVLSGTSDWITQNVNGSAVTISGNVTSSSTIIPAAGLETAYASLRSRVNLASGKTVTASTVYSSGWTAAMAIDGSRSSGWSPTASDTAAWWQVDLGSARQLAQFSITTRQDVDQSATRSGFEIRASNDATFATYAVLGRQDSRQLPYTATLTGKVTNRGAFRYVRIAKTDGGYFYLSEVSLQAGDGPSPASVSTPSVVAGTYYRLTNVNSAKVLDVYGLSTANGGTVDQWTSNGGTNQQWQILQVSGDLYRIVNRNSGLVLDVPNFTRSKGAALDQWAWNGGNNQLWYLDAGLNGGWVLRSLETGQVADVASASTADGATVGQYTPFGQANQEWTIQ